MAKPSKLPEWDTTQVNSIEPDQSHKDEGWLAPGGVPEKPPFQTFNYWQNEVYRWLDEINIAGILAYDASTNYIANISYVIGSDGNLYICWINNGPSTSIINPVGDTTGVWSIFETNIYRIDASETNQGITGNGKTIKTFVDAIGTSKKAGLVLTHNGIANETVYTITTDETIPSNIILVIENGAVLDGAGTLTLYRPDNIIAQPGQKIVSDNSIIKYSNSAEALATPVALSISVTVGSGLDYETINEAIANLTIRKHKHPGISAEIIIDENYVMYEQIVATTDLSWIVIRVENNAEIVIDRASMQTLLQIYGVNWPGWVGPGGNPLEPWFQAAAGAFMAIMGGVLPVMGGVFTMNSTGTASTGTHRKVGCFVGAGAKAIWLVDAGVKNADDRGLQVTGGTVYADGSIWDGAGDIGVRAANNSRVLVRRASIKNCSLDGICVAASMVSAREADVSGSGGNGLFATQGCVVDAAEIIASNCQVNAIYCYDNSIVEARLATLTGAITGSGIKAEHGGRVNAWQADLSNANSHGAQALYEAVINVHETTIIGSGGKGVYAGSGASINCQGSTITGSTSDGAHAENGARINARDAILTTSGGFSLSILYGSFLAARGATIDAASYSTALNTLSLHGAIFQ